jgi:DNA-directed RNA polymerase subunit RPC12/RpoP
MISEVREMAVRVVCRACGKQLKLPTGADVKRAAKCPKCGARVDLGAALEASAYLPTFAPTEATTPKPPPAPPKPITPSKPAGAPRPTAGGAAPSSSGSKHPAPADEALSLDDDDGPATGGADPEPPFRVPVWVLADSARQIAGPCFAVLVPHGLFLEHEPMKPFLFAPVGCRAQLPAPDELQMVLPDRRAVALRFEGRAGRGLARDAGAFLAGRRPVPVATDYRRKWWTLWAALIFALGLVAGPLVLARAANLGWEFGLQVGAGFALVGLFANAAIAVGSRWSVPGQLVLMACVSALLTGVFLFGAVAFFAGRQNATARTDPPTSEPDATHPNPNPNPNSADAPPAPAMRGPPSHVDRAYASGVSVLDDGPADVTALTIAPDGVTLGVGHADGTTRLCLLDQPTFDSILPGPKADGPVTRVRFDGTSRFVFAVTPAAAVGMTRGGPLMTFAKIPGAPVAISPAAASDRIHFAAVRGNTLQNRSLATAFVQRPPVKAKDTGVAYALPGKGDEVAAQGSGPDQPKPAGPTFLAWTPGGRLFAGQPDGAIAIWSSVLRPEAASRDHKAAVKAWADCPGTGDFATGDDQGVVAWWPYKGGKPTVAPVLTAPITALAFAPSGAWLAVADATGWLVIWDVAAGKALHRKMRTPPVKAMAFGPNDDVLILAAGRTVEVWYVPELVK